MDLLFKRYADPFSLINGYIQTARFDEFVDAFIEQKQEDDRWEFFLHKVWDKSYIEFVESVKTTQDVKNMSDVDIEATIKNSMKILGGYNPETEKR